ncbi:hypothetical protein HMPREF9244_00719 [Alloscardovia omnicolens F0580]|uniref:Uncharacterized protein n=1 Tax=Alloscardovia omnicolens F0580 TaxID=1321816 RepID=U1RAJ5_9BIFI|nr:hypothetical protein HMPREF9244_00719 [Alloscardovia omnicolens F0580]
MPYSTFTCDSPKMANAFILYAKSYILSLGNKMENGYISKGYM